MAKTISIAQKEKHSSTVLKRSSAESMFRRILVVDDDQDIRILLKTNLEFEGFRVDVSETLDEMRVMLKQRSYDAILLDIFVGHENGLDTLPELAKKVPKTKVIIMTGHGSVDFAVKAMQQGAANFLVKSSDPKALSDELKATIYSQYGIAALSDEPMPANLGIIGKSPLLRHVLANIDQMKNVDSTVMITGESGTGKELVARALHRLSGRAEGPFRAINCGAIPENLLESELFGFKKSAFTDAKVDRKGVFEMSEGGSLLLDEIGDMPIGLQVKLLRVLQEKEVTPIGASNPVKVDVRVLAATNRALSDMVNDGTFRQDLFYRLSVLRIDVPSLRDRRQDIPLLVDSFISRFNKRFEKSVKPPSHGIMARLMAYDWPGNVRELQNVIERGVVLSRDGNLRWEDLFHHVENPVQSAGVPKSPPTDGLLPFDQAKEGFERDYLNRLLAEAKGNISEASRISGQYRTKIYRMLDRYHIESDSFKRW